MTSVQTKVVAAQAPKKTLKKKPAEKELSNVSKKVEKELTELLVDDSKKVNKKKSKETAKVSEDSKQKKGKETVESETPTKKQTKKNAKAVKEPVEEVAEEPKKEKAPKKINSKPTLADLQGLNLSVAKVKNIVSNMCINKETFVALKDLKKCREFEDEEEKGDFKFSLAKVSPETIAYLDKCHETNVLAKKLLHSRTVVKEMKPETLKKYLETKRVAMALHQKSQKDEHLFQQNEFDLVAFNLSWDAK